MTKRPSEKEGPANKPKLKMFIFFHHCVEHLKMKIGESFYQNTTSQIFKNVICIFLTPDTLLLDPEKNQKINKLR